MNKNRINNCRICGNESLIPVVSIGDQYLSSIFPTSVEYRNILSASSLDLVLCEKNKISCGTLQLAHDYNLNEMYQSYPYTSSSNSAMRALLYDVASSGENYVSLQENDVILDIGGNDLTLLSYFKNRDCNLISIDPAKNVKPVFTNERTVIVRDYFNSKNYFSMMSKKAKLIFSVCMFYHLHDPVSFCREVKNALADDGVFVVQMAYMPKMLETNMFDNIVHEHVGYYSLENMKWIFAQAGLRIFNVEENDVYGGSFRIYACQDHAIQFFNRSSVEQLSLYEERLGLNTPTPYIDFNLRLRQLKTETKKLIEILVAQGKKIWVYGASTKGNTILQFFGLNHSHFEAAADCNPFKYGKLLIGSDIPIKTEKEMRNARPDYLFSLPYAFTDAFIKRESELVASGTKFIKPLPSIQILP